VNLKGLGRKCLILYHYSSLLDYLKMNITDPECGDWHAYHVVLRMKTLSLTGGTKIEVRALNALVAKPFHFLFTPITLHANMSVPTCETELSHFASSFVLKGRQEKSWF
jgi:hypothetical protein